MSDEHTTDFFELLADRLRAPLAPTRAAGEQLRMTAADPSSQRLGEVVLEQMNRLERMIDALQDLSLLKRGQLRTTHSEVELHRVIESAVEECRSALESKGQRLIVRMPEEWPRIEGDEPRLVQVVRNLLDNAVKFTPEGGSIDLSIAAVDSWAEIRVQDTGRGVTPTLLPRLFDPFAVAASAAHAESGLGLSLSITKHLVELHNGTISAHSDGLGEGSQFLVRLPLGRRGT